MKDALELCRNLNAKFEDETMKWKHLICEQINTSGASSAPPLTGKIAVILKDYLAGFYEIGQEIESGICDLYRKNSALKDEIEGLKKVDTIPISHMFYEGEYHPANTYKPGDIVYYDNSIYMCIKGCAGVVPSITDNHWRFLVGGLNKNESNDLEEKYNSLYLDHSSLYVDYLSVSKEYELFKENVSITDFDLVKPYVPGNIVYYKDELYLNVKQCVGVSPRIKNLCWKRIPLFPIKNSVNKTIIDRLHYDGLYEATMTYSEGSIVKYKNHLWVSLLDGNKIEPTKRDKNDCCTWCGISNSDKLVVRSNEFETVVKDKINATQHIKRLKDDYNDLLIKYNTIQNKLRIMSANMTDLVNNLKILTSPNKSPECKLATTLSCKAQASILYNECQELLEPIQSDFTSDLVHDINQIVNIAHINIDDIHQTDEDALETLDDIEAREGDIIKLARKVIEKIIGDSIDA